VKPIKFPAILLGLLMPLAASRAAEVRGLRCEFRVNPPAIVPLKPAAKAVGMKFLRMENNPATCEVGSGAHRFQAPLTKALK